MLTLRQHLRDFAKRFLASWIGLLLARLLLEHRLQPRDPLAAADADLEGGIVSQLLADDPVSLDTAATLLVPYMT